MIDPMTTSDVSAQLVCNYCCVMLQHLRLFVKALGQGMFLLNKYMNEWWLQAGQGCNNSSMWLACFWVE